VIDDGAFELVYRHRQTATTPFALPRLRRAGVERYMPPALPLSIRRVIAPPQDTQKQDSSPQGRTAYRAWRHPLRAARLQCRVDGLQLRFGDDRRNVHNRVLGFGFGRARLVVARIESVLVVGGAPSERRALFRDGCIDR